MANLPETASFDPVYQLERTDPVDAGINGAGISNQQGAALTRRTAWIKALLATFGDVVTYAASAFATAAQGAKADAAIPSAQLAAAGGVATLDVNGKLLTSQLPNLALCNVFVVASQAAQLALTADEGDVCVRTDQENQSYIHNSGATGTMTDWTAFAQQLPIASDAPSDGQSYIRKDGAWVALTLPDPSRIVINNIATDSRNLVVTDAGQFLLWNTANAASVALSNTVLSTDFPVTGQVTIANQGVGNITVSAPAGVTIKGITSLSNTAMHSIYRASANLYFVAGKAP